MMMTVTGQEILIVTTEGYGAKERWFVRRRRKGAIPT